MSRTPTTSVIAFFALVLSLPSCRASRAADGAPNRVSADSVAALRQMAVMRRWVDSAAAAMGVVPGHDSAGRRVVASAGDVARDGAVTTYACAGDYRFTARVRGDSALLALPGRDVVVRRVGPPAGEAFSGGGFTFRRGGPAATLDTPDGRHTGCAPQDASPR